MGMVSKAAEGAFKAKPPIIQSGTTLGICCAFVDIGTQIYEKKGTTSRRMFLTFELPNRKMTVEGEDGEKKSVPRLISLENRLSLDVKANFRKHLESWRGRSFTKDELEKFDDATILGKGCQLNIMHQISERTGEPYAKIYAVLPLAEGQTIPELQAPLVYYSIEQHGLNVPEGVPQFMKDRLCASPEWRELQAEASGGNVEYGGTLGDSGPNEMTDNGDVAEGPIDAPPEDSGDQEAFEAEQRDLKAEDEMPF